MGGEILHHVSSQAYLGVEIHENLNWKSHITTVASKAGRNPWISKKEPWQVLTTNKRESIYLASPFPT